MTLHSGNISLLRDDRVYRPCQVFDPMNDTDEANMSDEISHTTAPDWHLDKRLPMALIFAIAIQSGAGLIWAGAAGERIRQLEDQALLSRNMTERLVRVEEQIGFALQTLDRIERKLDRQSEAHGDDE